jgi:hypothetical protein
MPLAFLDSVQKILYNAIGKCKPLCILYLVPDIIKIYLFHVIEVDRSDAVSSTRRVLA